MTHDKEEEDQEKEDLIPNFEIDGDNSDDESDRGSFTDCGYLKYNNRLWLHYYVDYLLMQLKFLISSFFFHLRSHF